MRIGYADPPYPGMAHFYSDHPDYGGEVDHQELLARLDSEYDGWILHTASTTLAHVLRCAQGAGLAERYRIMAWVKSFASFKPNVCPAYAWEPVLVAAARKPEVSGHMVMRDWYAESITLKRGLVGAKPERVCHWLFEVVGAHPDDVLDDLYPGSGAVTGAWGTWRSQLWAVT